MEQRNYCKRETIASNNLCDDKLIFITIILISQMVTNFIFTQLLSVNHLPNKGIKDKNQLQKLNNIVFRFLRTKSTGTFFTIFCRFFVTWKIFFKKRQADFKRV